MILKKAWSYSSLNKFKTCPHQYHEVNVLKNFIDSPGVVAQHGTYIHKCIEDYITDGVMFPDDALGYIPRVQEVLRLTQGMELFSEIKLGMNEEWETCDFDTAWCRGIIDLMAVGEDTAYIIDWKLGKVRQGSAQLKLMALLTFAHCPQVEKIVGSYEYLAHGVNHESLFYREHIPAIREEFSSDLSPFYEAFDSEKWKKKKSGLCYGWCPVTSCNNWREKRA